MKKDKKQDELQSNLIEGMLSELIHQYGLDSLLENRTVQSNILQATLDPSNEIQAKTQRTLLSVKDIVEITEVNHE